MIEAVIFDLDDTLYDEIEYCRSGFRAVADFLAAAADSPDAEGIFNRLWSEFSGGNRTKTFNAVLEQLKIDFDEKLIEKLVSIYRNHKPKIMLPNDSRKALDKLITKYKLALLTDGFLPAQELKVRALGLEQYFKNNIIYTEQLGRKFWKPSPAGFEKIIRLLKVKPQAAVYVADNSEKDFIAPNKLGIITIQIIRPRRTHTSTSAGPGAAAQYSINKIDRLPVLIASL